MELLGCWAHRIDTTSAISARIIGIGIVDITITIDIEHIVTVTRISARIIFKKITKIYLTIISWKSTGAPHHDY